jgi:hypothetical protein
LQQQAGLVAPHCHSSSSKIAIMPVPSMIIQDQWRIVTQTSNMFGAGTDAPVFVQVTDKTHHLPSTGPDRSCSKVQHQAKKGGGASWLSFHTFEVPFPIPTSAVFPPVLHLVHRSCGAPMACWVVQRSTWTPAAMTLRGGPLTPLCWSSHLRRTVGHPCIRFVRP